MNENIKVFMVYVSSLKLKITIHPAKEAHMALFLAKKVTVLAEYLDFANIFLEKSANILPEQTEVNKYGIQLEEDKQ